MFIIKKNLNKFAAKEIKPFSFRALPFHVETEPLQAGDPILEFRIGKT